MTNPTEPVEVELRVQLPRGRIYVVREEAEASDIAGGDEMTALALVGRATRSAIGRYADGAQQVLELFERLQHAVGAGPAPVNVTEPPEQAARRMARKLEEIRGYLLHYGSLREEDGVVDSVRATAKQRAELLGRVQGIVGELRRAGYEVVNDLDPAAAIGEAMRRARGEQATDADYRFRDMIAQRNALARIVEAARHTLLRIGYPADSTGDDQLSNAVKKLDQNRRDAWATAVKEQENRERAERNARGRASIIASGAAVRIADTGAAPTPTVHSIIKERDTYAAAIAEAAKSINGSGLLDDAGDRVVELPEAVDLLLDKLRKVTADRDRFDDDNRRVRGELRNVARAVADAGISVSGDGMPGRLSRAVRDALTRRAVDARWRRLLDDLENNAEQAPMTITSVGGGPVVRLGQVGDQGSISIFPRGDESGTRLGPRDARRFFLAAVRALYPSAGA